MLKSTGRFVRNGIRVFSSAAARKRGVLVTVLVSAAFVLLYLSLRRYAPFVFHPDELRVWIDQFGILAPAVFMLIQIGQVVVAPVPGQAVALVAGYLFGPVAGTVYSITGVLIGSAIAFLLADRYGRTFVEDILDEDVVARFDEFVDRIGFPGLVAFVIIPGLPETLFAFSPDSPSGSSERSWSPSPSDASRRTFSPSMPAANWRAVSSLRGW